MRGAPVLMIVATPRRVVPTEGTNSDSKISYGQRGLTGERLSSHDNTSVLPSAVLAEFAASAISEELAAANIRWIEGPEAVNEFLEGTFASRQRVQSYITASNARTRSRYRHLEAGGWITYGVTLADEPATTPQIKPCCPRLDEDGDPIKYENPPGLEGRPILPDMRVRIPGGWQGTLRSSSPVVLVEGVKKAQSCIEQGTPAVALRSVTQWHSKGSRNLYPELAELCKGGREILIAFDQDPKLKTRAGVSKQAELLGNAVERAGGKARFIVWDASQGKGIDDALAALPEEDRADWLNSRASKALTPKEYRRLASVAQAKGVLAAPEPVATHISEGEYLPKLPRLTWGAAHWLSAAMNSGKTVRIGEDWVKPAIAAGWIVVVLTPLVSLGQQVAGDEDGETPEDRGWNLPHIHDYYLDANSQQALRADIRARGGIVACFNSAGRVQSLIPQDSPMLLVVDEAAQVFTDAAEGGTLKQDWANTWEAGIALMQRAAANGAIVLSEAGIDSDTIQLVERLSGAGQTIGIRHHRKAQPWDVWIDKATPLSGWRAQLLAELKAGKRILYVCTSQEEAERLEMAAKRAGIDVDRVDAKTNEAGRYRDFFKKPKPWLYKRRPQLLILTPTAKTGLSIEGGVSAEDAYFDQVWGYFPALDTDTQMQLLGRYRPPVPRFVWAPAYIAPEYGENPYGGRRELMTEAARYAAAAGFEQAPADKDNDAIHSYLAARRRRRWAQKITAADALADALEGAGHSVVLVKDGSAHKETAALWTDIKEAIARDRSDFHAGLKVDPSSHTLDWAQQILKGTDSTYEQRCRAAKVRMMARFPGLDWDSSKLWYAAAFCPKTESRGPVASGAALWAESEHIQLLWLKDASEARRVLSQRLKAAHLLPTASPRAALAAVFRPMVEALFRAGRIVPGGKAELQIKAVGLKYRAEVRQYWRLTIDESQSEEAISAKICKKFGFEVSRQDKIRHDGRQAWTYEVKASPEWLALVEARKRCLAMGTDLLEGSINKFVPPSPTDLRPDPLPRPFPPPQARGLGGDSSQPGNSHPWDLPVLAV